MSINQSFTHGIEILFLCGTSIPFLAISEILEQLEYRQSKTYRLIKALIKYSLLQEKQRAARCWPDLNALRSHAVTLIAYFFGK